MTALTFAPRRAAALAAAAAVLGFSCMLGTAPGGEPTNTPPANPAPQPAPANAPPANAPPAAAPAATPAPTTPAHEVPKDLPPASDVLAASAKAMGGKEAIDKISSLMVKATGTSQMGDMKMSMQYIGDEKLMLSQTIPNMGDLTIAWNGNVGWVNSPMTQGYQLLREEQISEFKGQIRQQMDFHGMVLHLSDEFPTNEVVDRLPFADEDCYKVKLVNKSGAERFGFFSVASGLIRGMEVNQSTPMGEAKIVINFEEWQKKNDLMVFTKMAVDQMGMKMNMAFDEIEFNKVDPAVFEPPADVIAMVKARDAAPPPGTGAAPSAPPAGNSPPPSKPAPSDPPASQPK